MRKAPVFSLSIHADYRCRHQAACCATAWDVPVELSVYRTLADAAAAGRLRERDGFLTDQPPDGAAAVLRRRKSGACVFLEPDTRFCAIHRELGEGALPSACRLFPRIALSDARGTFITLSHYCPTAAAMVFREDVELAIVASPPAFPPGEYEGLAAGDTWPPLLWSRMLMDDGAYGAWERHAVRLLASPSVTPEAALGTLDRDVESLRRWLPGDASSLRDAIANLPEAVVERPVPRDVEEAVGLHGVVTGCVPVGLPPELRPDAPDGGLDAVYRDLVRSELHRFRRPINRYLAAHAFANWCAYQGRGLRTFVMSLRAALATLEIACVRQCRDARRALDAELLLNAVRQSDFLLRHLASREALTTAWSRAEDD